jgi:catechol 2,3-dioxygenase-like lactoylglutathione lyase family enzyme
VTGPEAPRAAFIDHVTLVVRDYEASKRFYRAALAPWGSREVDYGDATGFGPEGSEDLVVAPGEPGAPLHVAFAAPDRATVDAFYERALAAGGRDHGAPGLRPHHHPGYYAAYVLDPDGNNVEAVFHDRTPRS